MLVQLIYASRVGADVDNLAVRDILRRSQANNHRLGITGALCFSGSFFLQCLEGERGAVNRLYNRILGDPRHRDCQLLSFAELVARDFVSWDMGYVALSAENRALFLRHSASADFDPETMSAASVRALFAALVERANWLRAEA